MISHAIATERPVAEKYYHICWWEEAVRCRHVRHTPERHEVFFSAPGSVLLGELSAVQWRLLITRIEDFCARRGLVLDLHSGAGQYADRSAVRRAWVTEFDSARLHVLLAEARAAEPALQTPTHLDKLQGLLATAYIVAPGDVPEDVVTMNSQVRLRNDDHDLETDLFLVFPADARSSDFGKPKVSIFTDTGLSLLGRRIGDRIDESLRILDLPYQPEAAGEFEL
jgi:regulator of nucleoside diphosphate kinase